MSEVLDFIKYIEDDCISNGFILDIQNVKYIDTGDGAPSSGYFSEDEKKICVSMKSKDFIGILAHEYSHLRQYIENEELYNYYSKSYIKVFQWLDGARVQKIQHHLDNSLLLELDCEKRSVDLMKNFDLGVDIKDYIKRANAYIYFWKYLKYSRKWCNPYNTPSNNESLVSAMPSRFLKKYELTDKIKEIFIKEAI
jgi:hypothetical protein